MKANSIKNLLLRNRLLSFLVVIFVSISISAQNKTVSGTVFDADGMTVIGANVTLIGSKIGTITDMDGKFSISVPTKDNPILSFSYIGFTTQEIEVGNKTSINVILREDAQVLDELIVVGYGTQKKSHLTGSVSQLKGETFSEVPVSSVEQALQGRIAGVSIQNNTSEVGVASDIRIRGMGSISAGSSPLVVVDGYPMQDGLENINAEDIESIDILKDAASAAIYGSRAAGGVILITTKSADITKPKYTFKAYGGVKWAYQKHDLMNTNEYYNMLEADYLKGGPAVSNADKMANTVALRNGNTDWQNEALRTAKILNAQLNISGGKKELKYYISAGITSDEGIMIKNALNKFTMRAKVDAMLSKRVNIGINFAPTYQERERPATSFIDFYRTYSWLPVKHTEYTSSITNRAVGTYSNGRDFNQIVYTDNEGNPILNSSNAEQYVNLWNTANNNPLSIINNEFRKQKDYSLNTSAYITINIAKGLDFKSSNGFYFKYTDVNRYANADARKDNQPNVGEYGNTLYLNLLSENTLNYTLNVNKHNLNVLAGFTAESSTNEYANILGYGFATDDIYTLNGATVIDLEGTRTLKTKSTLMSVLARVSYSYADRYLASVSFRGDASSLFGPSNRWGFFPSVSLGWRVSEETFMKGASNWLDQLKIRASWGITGNNNIPAYVYLNRLSSSNYVLGDNTGSIIAGLANTATFLGNNSISWEQTDEFNVGIDWNMLKSRINIVIDGYYSSTRQLLFKQPAMSITGFNQYWNNVGKVRNMGIETDVQVYWVKNKNFDWSTSFNIASNDNRLLDLGGDQRIISQGERNELYLAEVGSKSIQYYGYKTIGVWENEDMIKTNPSNPVDKAGGLRVADMNEDGKITEQDMVALGSPFADFTWGITNSIRWKNLDFSFLISGSQGGLIFNGDGYYNESRRINRNYVENRWVSGANPGDGKTPYYTNGRLWQETDYMLEDASYGCLRNVMLGYTFSKKDLKKMKISKLRIYASGANLAYVWGSSYRGINPEARYTSGEYSSPLISGYQRGGFPLQSTVTLGLDINF